MPLGALAGLGVDADIGHGFHPVPGRRVHGGKSRRDVQTGKEVLFDVAHSVFNPPFFVCAPHVAGAGFEAVVGGKVQIARVEGGLLAHGVAQYTRLEVVDEHRARDTPKVIEGVALAGQEVLHGFPTGELDVGHA